MKNKNVPSNFKKEILSFLEEGKTPNEISNLLNLVYCSTQQMCNKLGYKFRPDQGNIRYFQNIDTSLKAYFLGFIAADGGIVKNTLTITIHKKDKEILDTLKREIGCEKPLINIIRPLYKGSDEMTSHIRFTLSNPKLIQDLNNLGIFSRKSLTIGNIIKNIPYEFRNSFIIGYFDGDGSVLLPKGKIKKTNNKYYPSYSIQISIRGTKELLTGILNHLNIQKNLVFNKTYILSLCKKEQIVQFLNCYNHLNFYLKRKYDKIQSRINHTSFQKIIQDQTISSP